MIFIILVRVVFMTFGYDCGTDWWQVTLTWDETPHERVAFMARDFTKDELADQDLRDYVASDTDSDGTLLLPLLCMMVKPCCWCVFSDLYVFIVYILDNINVKLQCGRETVQVLLLRRTSVFCLICLCLLPKEMTLDMWPPILCRATSYSSFLMEID